MTTGADRIIFLDIDGVLNSASWFKSREMAKKNYRDLDPSSIACLNAIVATSGASIVLSSTWRLTNDFPETIRFLKAQGIEGNIIGRTPRLDRPLVRGHEIHAWMQSQVHWPRFVILDDDTDMAHLLPWLVKTDTEMGLCKPDVGKALAVLDGPAWNELRRAM